MMGNGNGQSCLEKSLSGIEIDTQDGRKPITQVINLHELAGDSIRAALLRSIRAAILEAQHARKQAKLYIGRNGIQPTV